MAIFIDRHAAEVVPSEVFARMLRESDARQVDPSGVRIVGHWVDDHRLYCVLEAPDAAAVHEHHTARGLACDDLRVMDGSGEDDGLVHASIVKFWSAPAS